MFEISRMTIVYDPEEDRMALDAADASGRVRRLWLTRRLLDRLVVALTQALAPEVAREVPAGRVPAVGKPVAQVADAAQVYAQLQARVAKKPERPVSACDCLSASRVQTIDLAKNETGTLRLTFKFVEDEPAGMIIPPPKLRQWLEVLHRNYLKAGWTTAAWPAWVGTHSNAGLVGR